MESKQPYKNLSFKEQLALPDPLFGVILTLPSPEIAEILAEAGFDWIFIDLEHSALSLTDAQRIMQAAAGRTRCVIRCPGLDEIWIKRCLDLGPDGIIIPRIRTPEEAERAVRWCMYPPRGTRSAGLGRAQKYGAGFGEYLRTANNSIAVILQAEDREAVESIDDILSVAGISGIFAGPFDLSGSYGVLGDVESPEVRNGIEKIRAACLRSSVPAGIFCGEPEQASQYAAGGFSLIALGSDGLLLGGSAKNVLLRAKTRGR